MLFFKYNSVMMRSWMKVLVVIGVLACNLPIVGSAQTDSLAATSVDTALAKRLLAEAKDLLGKSKSDEAEEKLNRAGAVFEKVLGKESLEYADVMHQMGRVWGGRRDYDKVLSFTQQALEIRQKLLGNEHTNVADSFYGIGNSYGSDGQYEKAIENHEKALEIRQKLLGNEHLDVANSLNNLGNSYDSNGQYEKAIENHEKALEIRQKLLGNEHRDVANSLNNLGNSHDSNGQYDKAIEYYEKALMIRQKLLGNEHLDVANSLNNLGNSYNSNSQYEKAIENHKKALEIRQKLLGNEHTDVADSFYNIGNSYDSNGQYDKAIENHERALEIRQKLLGNEHRDVANSLNNLGNSYNSNGQYDKAIENYEKALEIRQKSLGNEHTDVADSFYNIGNSHESNGQYEKAIESHEKAIEIRQKILGNEHIDVANSANNLGISYESSGDYENAIKYYEKGLEIRQKLLGNEHTDVADSFSNLGDAYDSNGQYDRAIQCYEKDLGIRLKLLGVDNAEIADIYESLGNSNFYKGEYLRSMEYHEKALGIRQKALGRDHLDAALSYNNIGALFVEQAEYHKAIEYFGKSLEILIKILGREHFDVAASYNNIGICYQYKGDYDQAIEYFGKAIEIRRTLIGEDDSDIAQSYHNIGAPYESKGEHDKAIGYFRKALEIFLITLGTEHPYVAASYSSLGVSYNSKGDYKKALEYASKSLEIRTKVLGMGHSDTAESYHNIGISYARQKEYDQAIEYFEKGLDIFRKTWGEEHPNVAESYISMGINYGHKNEYEKAVMNFSKALQALKYQYPNFSEVSSLEELQRVLQLSSLTHQTQYTITRSISLVHQSLSYAQQALAAIDYQSSTFTTESTKTHWQSTYHPTYAQAIDISLLAADVNQNDTLRRQTFTYAEKSKASQLQAQLKNADALAFSGIPDSLTQQEYQLRVDLSWREKQRQALLDKGKTETDSTVLRLSSILFDLRQQYDTLKTRFEKNYPEYYRLKYDLRTVSLDYVQDSLLQPGQTLLEYFVGDSSIYLFLVQPKNYEVIEIKKDTAFEQWVEDLTRNGIYGYYGKKGVSKGKSIANYGTSAYQLYETLIAPIKAKLPKDEKLIIIPDGILGYVPFEALLTQKPPRPDAISAYKYLIQDHQISYCYSATLLKEMRNKKHRQEPTQKLLAMAPFFLGNADTLLSQVDSTEFIAGISLRDTLTALPNSGEEVARIHKILKGQALYGKAATLAQFQKLAAQARILHLSTHGEADDRLGDYAYLAFGMPNADGTFEKLYARDLYNLSLNADLVVLSACETGIGKLQRGEGIVSLARAFAYAGAKSIVTTLWKVSDEQSKNLMSSFYKYLSKGKEKDEALRLAKLDFLKANEKRTELLHPFFWASFIGIGDMERIK